MTKQVTLEKLLEMREISQLDLAIELELTPQAVSKWVNGRCLPATTHVLALERVLSATVDLRKLCAGKLSFDVVG